MPMMGGMGMDMGDHVMQNMTSMDHSNMTGMDHSNMEGMDHSNMTGMDQSNMEGMDHSNMEGMDHSNMEGMDQSKMKSTAKPAMKGMDHSGMAMPGGGGDPFYMPGSGLMPKAYNGGKFLSYKDLRAAKPLFRHRAPSRTIVLRLTGNMERYIWSINDVKFDDADPIVLRYGERVRMRFVNETMMSHPMHLHGMWSIVDAGHGARNPIKHTVNINPGATTDMEVEVDATGQWAFHCHLSYHADAGMFRKVVIKGRAA